MVSHGQAFEALLPPRISIACLLLPTPVSILLKFLSPILTFLLPLNYQIPATFFISRSSAMADDRSPTAALLRRVQDHAPQYSPQLLGFLTLFISASILIFLAGLTATATALALIFLTPLILLTFPFWAPLAFFLFVAAVGLLSFAGLAVGLSWAYRYYKGMHPPGSDQLEYATSRIYDTATHVKDYAREYGGYLQSKVKDAAPGA